MLIRHFGITHNFDRLRTALLNIGTACVIGGFGYGLFRQGDAGIATGVVVLGVVLIYLSICEVKLT